VLCSPAVTLTIYCLPSRALCVLQALANSAATFGRAQALRRDGTAPAARGLSDDLPARIAYQQLSVGCGLAVLDGGLWVALMPVMKVGSCTCNYAMPCHAMPCHAMPCHAMPCHAMPCHAMPCHAMPCHAMPCHVMPYHTILWIGPARSSRRSIHAVAA
jgi:hypothetical protein